MENKTFKDVIKNHLDGRARTDELFAKSYAKENKNLDECCSYIMGEARKRGSAVAMTDEEVFGMAIHYYDEDDIKVSKMPAGTRASISTFQPVELTEEEKKAAREAAIWMVFCLVRFALIVVIVPNMWIVLLFMDVLTG